MQSLRSKNGQSLIELIVAVAVGVLFIVAALGIITLSLRVDFDNKFSNVATELVQEVVDQVGVFANANWNAIDAATKSTVASPTYYQLNIVGSFYTLVSGKKVVVIDNNNYETSFIVEEVYRDGNNNIVTVGGTLDPATLKIVATASWIVQGSPRIFTVNRYISRIKNRVFAQTDWSGGPGQTNKILTVNNKFYSSTDVDYATNLGSIFIQTLATSTGPMGTNIHIDNRWAWNDTIGWIDFRDSLTVTVSTTIVTGYASSSVGDIALNCDSTPSGDICSTVDFKVENDGSGNLSGWAWNDTIGWINFSGSTPDYQVTIDANGVFHGWAWNDIIGWILFNCEEVAGLCATSDFKVQTTWNTPPVQATLKGTYFKVADEDFIFPNTILWQGNLPNDTAVKFQIAGHNIAGGTSAYDDSNYMGPDGTQTSFYQPTGADTQVRINKLHYLGKKFISYKVILVSDEDQSISPTIDDIIINWSE